MTKVIIIQRRMIKPRNLEKVFETKISILFPKSKPRL